jgi:hypothetical protein
MVRGQSEAGEFFMRKLLFLMAFLGAEASAQTFDLTECQTVDEMLLCPVRNSGDNAFHSIRYAVVAVEDGRTFPWAETTGVVEIPGGAGTRRNCQRKFSSSNTA